MRHGESTFNTGGIVQGRGFLDRPERQSVLTEKGLQQAELAGSALSGLPIAVAYSSPLIRAHQTAKTILASSPSPPSLKLHEGLLEIDLSSWEELTFTQVRSQFPEAFDRWQNTPHELVLDGRYPVLDLFAQARAFWQEILARHTGETILLVSHSGISRALIATALGLHPSQYHNLQKSNCGISVLNFKQGQDKLEIQLESLNLTSHLAPLTNSVLPSPRKDRIGPRVLLVRHGETEWNRAKRFQGQIDVPLNPKGEEQAQLVAEFLRAVPINVAFSSPMLRPKDTALQILADRADVSLQFIDDLKEISHGLWEGKLETEIEAEFPGELQKWQATPETVQMPEGENLGQVWQRVAQAWQQIIATTPTDRTALVVAHDAVNKAILCQLFNLGPEDFWKFKQGNGGVSVIDYHRGCDRPPTLEAANVTTHLSGSILDVTAAGAL